MSTISDKLLQLNSIKEDIFAATKEHGLDTSGHTLSNIHELWSQMIVTNSLQTKTALPSDVDVEVTPDAGYDALAKIIVEEALNLKPHNIREGITMFGIEGTMKTRALNTVPDDFVSDDPDNPDDGTVEDANSEYEDTVGKEPTEDMLLLVDNNGNRTYAYLSDNFKITSYNPITTEFQAVGWERLSYHTTGELAGTWTYDDFTTESSVGWNYLKHIITCTREKLYYNGVEVYPNSYPLTPMLAESNTWYKGATAKSSITKINLVDTYSPTGSETESWAADVYGNGSIMCYVTGTTLTIAGDGSGKIVANPNSSMLFGYSDTTNSFKSATSITGLDILDTIVVTNMSFMFRDCTALKSLDLSKFNTSNVKNMGSMFGECDGLTSLDLSSFDTSSTTIMGAMFIGANNLTKINMSSFDTSNVTDMSFMFAWCSSMKSIDVSNFDTRSVTDMGMMFGECDAVSALSLTNFDTSSVTNMNGMFNGCDALDSVNLSSFNTSAVTDMQYMFNWCKDMNKIYVGSGWDTSNANTSNMFSSCAVSSVTKVDFPQGLILDATARFVSGGMSPNGANKYVGTNSARLRVGYSEDNDIKIQAGKVVTVDLKTYEASNWAMWFITSSGAAKVATGETLTLGTDYIDTGWMTSGQTYTVPEDTQFIWLNFRTQDNGSVSLWYLYSFVIREVV